MVDSRVLSKRRRSQPLRPSGRFLERGVISAALALAVGCACVSGPVHADRVAIEAKTLSSDVIRPHRGMTMVAVEAKFGSPESAAAPVGEPPITRWHYPQFTVYFEHNRVIHTVLAQ